MDIGTHSYDIYNFISKYFRVKSMEKLKRDFLSITHMSSLLFGFIDKSGFHP